MNDTVIRLEKPEDYRQTENLVREALWNVYRPGCSEHCVIHVLRDDPAFAKEPDTVTEQDGRKYGSDKPHGGSKVNNTGNINAGAPHRAPALVQCRAFIVELPHNTAAHLAVPFPTSAACRFLDLPPVNLRNLQLHLSKNSLAS